MIKGRSGVVRSMALVTLLATALGLPSTAAAATDCGELTVEPASGMVGTAFTISGKLGDPTRLTLFHEGKQVAQLEMELENDDSFKYRFGPMEPGRWRALAVIPDTECGMEVSFTAKALPQTTTTAGVPVVPPAVPAALLAQAALLAFLAGWQRLGGGDVRRIGRKRSSGRG